VFVDNLREKRKNQLHKALGYILLFSAAQGPQLTLQKLTKINY